MARPRRGCLITSSQQEGEEEPDRESQQEGQLDATGGKDIADYDLDIDYEGSEPKFQPVTQVEREADPDAEYAKMEIPLGGTLCQRMMPQEQYKGILWEHMA